MLTDAQILTLGTGMRASADPAIVDAIAIGNAVAAHGWVNTPSASNAWNPSCDKRTMFEATDVTKFDNLSAGKRDAWRLMMDNAPIDFGRNKMRKAVTDTWGATDDNQVFTDTSRPATNGELILGAADVAEGGVTLKKLTAPGVISRSDVEQALIKTVP